MKKLVILLLVSSNFFYAMQKSTIKSALTLTQSAEKSTIACIQNEDDDEVFVTAFGNEFSFVNVREDKRQAVYETTSAAPIAVSCPIQIVHESDEVRESKSGNCTPERENSMPSEDDTENRMQRAISKYRELLNEWSDPEVGKIVAVAVHENIKVYGKILQQCDQKTYVVDIGPRHNFRGSPRKLSIFQLFSFRNPVKEVILGQCVNSEDIKQLPRVAVPLLFGTERKPFKPTWMVTKTEQQLHKECPGRVVINPVVGDKVLFAFNKKEIVGGKLSQVTYYSLDDENQYYNGDIYTVLDENKEIIEIPGTIFTIRSITSLLLDEVKNVENNEVRK